MSARFILLFYLHLWGESGRPREVGLDRREILNLGVKLASQSVLSPLIELSASSRSANAGNNQVDCVTPHGGELANEMAEHQFAVLISEDGGEPQSGMDHGHDLAHGGSSSRVSLSHKSIIAENGRKTSFLFVYFAFFFFIFLFFSLDT